MKKNELMVKASNAFGKFGLSLKNHSPEILVVAGILGTVTATVMACKATIKAKEVLTDSTKEKVSIAEAKYASENGLLAEGVEYTQQDYNKDITTHYVKLGLKMAKIYAPAVAVGVLSITGILASNNILRKRNVGLAAAYVAVDTAFKEYRGRVVDRFGKQVDHELKYNIKAEKFEATIVDEKGKEKKVKTTVEVTDPNTYSGYARFFDDGCIGWEKNPEYNLMLLRSEQNYANDRLKARGYLFLNEVYERLGIHQTEAGQMVGWVYSPDDPNHKGDNFVDFGIYDVNRKVNREFVNGYERAILLDFNVDGPIIDKVWPKKKRTK